MPQPSATTLTASRLRIILITIIAVIFALCIAGFLYFRSQLVSFAEQVQSDNATATSSSSDIIKLQNLEKQLKDDSVAVTRAKNIVADSQYYQYQNQIINDINVYAKNSGVAISGYTFLDAAPGTAAAPAPVAAPGTAAVVLPAGLKSTTAAIAVKNPTSYTAIMKFIHSIELNLTRMQISGVSIAGSTTNPNEITVSPITVEVYTR